jgi:cellobiose phosphorylase
MIAGPDAPRFGEAKNSWLTGTAAWNFVAATQWILGIRPEHDGLRIDPSLPSSFGDVTITRRFRGATYRIVVRKAVGTTGRVRRLRVGGRPVEGTLAPLPDGSRGEIEVEAVVEPLLLPGAGEPVPAPSDADEDAKRSRASRPAG